MRALVISTTAMILAAALACCQTIDDTRARFVTPPPDARIMMRWWWFGSAVTPSELEAELRMMQFTGVGGFEVQPVYPLQLDDPSHDFKNLPYLSDGYLNALRYTANKAKELNLRMDITLGSGWPFGGPHVPITEAAGRLRCDRVTIPAGAKSVAMPSIGEGESLLAIFLAKGDGKKFDAKTVQPITPLGFRLQLPEGGHHNMALFFIASRTGQQVKRPAVGAEGFVLDHYSRAAIEHHLLAVGERLLTAFRDSQPPYSVFSDSLEVYGSDWTPNMLAEFSRRRGYGLAAVLPALLDGIEGDLPGPRTTADIRHDWGLTLSELCDENYLTPIREWAKTHGTKFRSQTYGIPPVTLSSNALVDLPEGEHGPYWRTFSVARWAASASHLYGRNVTSSETWTWLHSPVFRATPLDMKAEADIHFLQGINQLIGHGWPYSPRSAGEPGWRFYAAAVFNNHNPWWPVMPDIYKYFQRVSALLRQGKPANDVALYLPTHDAFSRFTVGGRTSVDQSMESLLGPDVIPHILDAGYNFDFTDDGAIGSVGLPNAVLVIPNLKRMPEATQAKINDYKKRGGIVVDLRTTSIDQLGSEIAHQLKPDFATGVPEIGFIHRKLDDGELYFVVNTSNHAVHAKARARVAESLRAEWWSPDSGFQTLAKTENGLVDLDLAPYESCVIVYTKSTTPLAPSLGLSSQLISDLSAGWNVTFAEKGAKVHMDKLRSWTDDEATLYYSGTANYERTFDYQPGKDVKRVFVNFGEGTAVDPPSGRTQGYRALLESPVREAAIVQINGQIAGSVWHPPYELDVTSRLRPGANTIRIFVSNSAMNRMSGQKQPDYKLLNLRYTERFTPQDMNKVEPLPSGILGPVTLVAR